MNMLTTLTIVAALTIAAKPSIASTVLGTGATSCGRHLSDVDTHDDGMLAITTSWVQGYLSGINVMLCSDKKPQLRTVDLQTIQAFTTKHCRDNPLDDVSNAATALAFQLSHPK